MPALLDNLSEIARELNSSSDAIRFSPQPLQPNGSSVTTAAEAHADLDEPGGYKKQIQLSAPASDSRRSWPVTLLQKSSHGPSASTLTNSTHKNFSSRVGSFGSSEFRIFLSAVTSEFGRARDALAADLRSRDTLVKVQSDFRQQARSETTLEKLHNYIRDCSAIVCIIGRRSGGCPPPAAAAPFLHMLPRGMTTASYTQWEFFFARHHRRRLSIYIADSNYVPDKPAAIDGNSPDLQRAFVQHIVTELGLDRSYFSNVDQLARGVLKEDWPRKPPVKPIALPYPSLGFLYKGRGAFMRRLHDSLMRTAAGKAAIVSQALYGLGGIGKTRAAVEYAWAYLEEYTALLFVIAETPEALRRNLAALTSPLLLLERDATEEEVRLRAVLDWLKANPGWLLILDNVDSPEAFEEAVQLIGQSTGGRVVMTSRLANFPAEVEPIELDVLNVHDATEFLLDRTAERRRETEDDAAEACELAVDLGQLALALEHAGAYIVRHRVSFDQYRTLWRDSREKIMSWSDPVVTHYPRAMAVTWHTSVARLSEEGRRLLKRLAWFSPEPIPEFLLDVPVPDIGDEFAAIALADLGALSLVTRSSEKRFFSVHRLVLDVTRHSLAAEHDHRSLEEALRWIDAAFTGDPRDVETWPRLDPLAPHALAIAEHAEREGIIESAARLTNALSQLFTTKASLAQSRIAKGLPPLGWLPPVLRIWHDKLGDALKPLEGLTNLQELSLRATYVGDVAPLAKWVNLQRLDLGRTKEISVAPLAKLTRLRSLDLWRIKVRDAAPIATLKNLQSLSLGHTWVADISPLADLVKLQRLDLSDTKVRDVTILARLINLMHLGLGGTLVRDVSVLAALKNLRSLDLSDTGVTDLTALSKLGNLQELKLNGTNVRNVSALAGLTGLANLDLSRTKVKDVSSISSLVNLHVLSLGGCAVECVTPIAGLIDLQVLNLGCTRIADAAALSGLTRLRSLDLRGTGVRDIRPIAGLTDLQSLDLAHTRVKEVAALASIERLKILQEISDGDR